MQNNIHTITQACILTRLQCIRNEKNQLLLGIRRANRPQTVMPSSVLSSDSMHLGLLAAAAHAAATNSRFTIFYNPRYVDYPIKVCHTVIKFDLSYRLVSFLIEL